MAGHVRAAKAHACGLGETPLELRDCAQLATQPDFANKEIGFRDRSVLHCGNERSGNCCIRRRFNRIASVLVLLVVGRSLARCSACPEPSGMFT